MLEELETNFIEDQTYERLVDLGYTFSPALEAASDFMTLFGSAINGKPPAMPARGTCMNCTDDEVKSVVKFMLDKAK